MPDPQTRTVPDSISLSRLQQLSEYAIPYDGLIDNGRGIITDARTDININEYVDSCNVYHYDSHLSMHIRSVRYTVQKGDALWKIAERYKISIEKVIADNSITDPDHILVGQELVLNVDRKQSSTVSAEYDLNDPYFQPGFGNMASIGNGYSPLSKSPLYSVGEKVHSLTEGVGDAFANHSRGLRVGDNWRLYAPGSSGSAFNGNQYVQTYSLQRVGERIGRITNPLSNIPRMPNVLRPIVKKVPVISIAFEGVEVYDGIQQDGGRFGRNATKETVGGVGNIVGGLVGAAVGAKVGVLIGSLFPPFGPAIGGIVFGIAGAYFGGDVVEDISEYIFDNFFQ